MFAKYYEALFGFRCPFSDETIARLTMLAKGNEADAVITYDREVGSSLLIGPFIYGKGQLIWDMIQSASALVRARVISAHGGRVISLHSKIVAPYWEPGATRGTNKEEEMRRAKQLVKLRRKSERAGK